MDHPGAQVKELVERDRGPVFSILIKRAKRTLRLLEGYRRLAMEPSPDTRNWARVLCSRDFAPPSQSRYYLSWNTKPPTIEEKASHCR